jgi:predicted RNase H-like nuclease (RuvC/YqgF family)
MKGDDEMPTKKELETSLREQMDVAKRLSVEKERLEARLENMRREALRLNDLCDGLSDRIASLEQTCANWSQAYTRLTEKNDHLLRDLERREAECKQLKVENDEVRYWADTVRAFGITTALWRRKNDTSSEAPVDDPHKAGRSWIGGYQPTGGAPPDESSPPRGGTGVQKDCRPEGKPDPTEPDPTVPLPFGESENLEESAEARAQRFAKQCIDKDNRIWFLENELNWHRIENEGLWKRIRKLRRTDKQRHTTRTIVLGAAIGALTTAIGFAGALIWISKIW